MNKHRTNTHTHARNRSVLLVLALFAAMLIPAQQASGEVFLGSGQSGWSSYSTGTWSPIYSWPPAPTTPTQPQPPVEPEPEPEEPSETPETGVRIKGLLAPGRVHETEYYLYDSGVAGPTVVVTGGMHGNEIAGWQAADVIMNYTVKKGKLIVIPRVNKPADEARTRTSSLGDLNRDFPRTKTESSDNYLATAIMDLMAKYRPDWLVDMHEGYDYHVVNSESVGQSVIYYPIGDAGQMAKAMADAASLTVSKSTQAYATLRYPVKGSLARAVALVFGTKGMIVETCNKQPLALRIKQHQVAVDEMLFRLGMK